MLPSIRSIMSIKGVTKDQAKQVRSILEMKTSDAVIEASETAWLYFIRCYHRPPLQMIKLTAIDAIIGTFGVEYQLPGKGAKSPGFEYLNTGDPYAVTLLWIKGSYRIAAWGNIVERGNYE